MGVPSPDEWIDGIDVTKPLVGTRPACGGTATTGTTPVNHGHKAVPSDSKDSIQHLAAGSALGR